MFFSARGLLPAAIYLAASAVFALDTNEVGLAALRREQPSLTGAGIMVAQTEAQVATNAWQVNPATVEQPVDLFTWTSDQGTATTFPNNVGLASGHARDVAGRFFHLTSGMAPAVQHVHNYEADYHYNNIVLPRLSAPAVIINQSWIFGELSLAEQRLKDDQYDWYATTYNVLFVSGVNNQTNAPPPPATAYNGIAVGRLTGPSSIGPTLDGRSKPDLVVTESATSYATPVVAGAAALLWQAAARADAGPGTSASATNASTIKALLLNGAVKPFGWTNGTTRPLDARHGAGVLNVYNSFAQLRAGRFGRSAASSIGTGAAHPPLTSGSVIPALRGWDYADINSTVTSDRVHHYLFDLPSTAGRYSATATLVWKRAVPAGLKNLDLFLYDSATGNLIASSESMVDNVEHLFVLDLPPGRYDLQVLKHGDLAQFGGEPYALAFDFVPVALSITRENGAVTIEWPINEAGFRLQTTDALVASPWQTASQPVFVTNFMNRVTVPFTNSGKFFRLIRP